ncbi:MAG: hypothetical protein IJ448_05165 [Oscillospiraceae bacterium]|nr:hypothetical protein [Oscillospiraceae bacterium]
MEKLLQSILEMEQPLVIIAIMLIAFCPPSPILMMKKINHWVKTIVVLVFGELGAFLLAAVSLAAKDAGVGGLLPSCTVLAIVMAVMVPIFSIVGHSQKWKARD